jgi:acyl-CoA synthetase (AMP-forming)/AMP-acid ligase II/thioesterase domain-containing protein/acyl carrier protein
VTDADGNNLYYSPWRFDLRPLRGILHAVYVYTPVLRFWLHVYRGQPTGELLDFATSQLIKLPLQLRMGLEQLHKHARLTPLGQELLTELEEQFAVLAEESDSLPLPADIPDLDFQRDGSFVYNLRSETHQLLTVKEAIGRHLQHFDRDGQIGRELQVRLGLDTSTPMAENKRPAITYGEKIAGNFQVISSLGATLHQEITRVSESQLLDLSTETVITRTYGDLWQQSQSLLGYLQQQGLSPGDLVILQLESCHDLVVAAWSCFAGGFIPVPVSNSLDSWKVRSGKTKLERLWQTLNRPVILTTCVLGATIKCILPENPPHLLTLKAAQGFPPSENFHAHQPEDLALLLTTSGTTGHPKLIAFDAITVISQFLSANRKSEDSSRFLTWLPLDNASGFSIVNPRAGLTLYLPPERFFGNPALWWQMIDRYQVRETLLTNFAMGQITERMQAIPRPNCDLSSLTTISLGAEKIVARTCRSFLQTLQPLGLRSDIFNIAYGLSETGVIASTRQWMAMADNVYGEQLMRIGRPLPGCGIRIVDRENNLLNEGEVGRIQVWSASRSGGYYDNPALNRQLFTEDDWLDTGDLGFLDQGYLTVTGREKETIIINGKNYSCQEIEIMVEEVPGVQPAYTVACSVRLPQSDTDELAIFFHTREDSLLADVILGIRGKITQNFGINPTYIIGVEKSAIPRTATGKIQRLQLKQDLEADAFATLIARGEAIVQRALEKTFVEPRNPLERQLTRILEQVLERKPIGIYDNFFDLGGDSISAVRLLAAIETTFGKDLALAALLQSPTVEKLAQILSQEQWSSSWYSLVPIQPLGDCIPLFAIHLLGEGLSFYRPLAGYLGLEQPIYGLNYGLAARKSGEKEASLPPIEELAAHYIQEMQTVQPQGPYILLGVSNGGNVAFEMAKQLHQQGQTVARLILFDTIHPQVKLSENWQNLSSFQKMILHCRRTIDIHWGNLWLFPPEERLPYIIGQVKNLSTQKLPRLGKILSSAIGRLVSGETKKPEKIKSQSPSYRQYIPRAYPGKIVLFKAKYSTLLPLELSNGWQGVAAEGLEIYNVHGAHSKILSEPSVRVLSEKLQDCLDKINWQ